MFSTQDYQCYAIPYGALGTCSHFVLLFQFALIGGALRSPLLIREIQHKFAAGILVSLQTLACVILHMHNLLHCTKIPAGLQLIGAAMVIATGTSGTLVVFRIWPPQYVSGGGAQPMGTIVGTTPPTALENGEPDGTEMQNISQPSPADGTAPEQDGTPNSPNNTQIETKQPEPSFRGIHALLAAYLATSIITLIIGNVLFANELQRSSSWYIAFTSAGFGICTLLGFSAVLSRHLRDGNKLHHFWVKLFNHRATAGAFWASVAWGLASTGCFGVIYANFLVGVANGDVYGVHRSEDGNDVVRYWLYFGFSKLALLVS